MAPEDVGPELGWAEHVELTRLYEQHAPRLRAMLDRRIDRRFGPKFDADDLISDVFLVAQRRWSQFVASEISPLGWLYRVGLDCLKERVRRERRTCRDNDRDTGWPERSSIAVAKKLFASSTTASKALERTEVQGRVREAIDRLEANDRDVLYMRHFDGLSPVEIAEVLSLTPAAVYQRLSRALRRLTPVLADLAPDEDLSR